jgi:hypothetical protein
MRAMIIGGAMAFFLALSWHFSLTLNTILLITLYVILCGSLGYFYPRHLQPKNIATSNNNNPRRIIQFSLARLLLATAMVALVFGIMKMQFDFKQPVEIFVASMIAISLGGLVLICDKREFIIVAPLILMIAYFVIAQIITYLLIYFHLIRH